MWLWNTLFQVKQYQIFFFFFPLFFSSFEFESLLRRIRNKCPRRSFHGFSFKLNAMEWLGNRRFGLYSEMGISFNLNRKDSFITHRAFCDALAEERARITSVAATNLNFRNDSMNETVINPQPGLLNGFSGRGGPDAAGISQFCPGFGPDLTGIDDTAKFPPNQCKFEELNTDKWTKS